MKSQAILWTALLLAASPLAAATLSIDAGHTEEMNQEVSQLKDAVADHAATDGAVYQMAQALFGRVPGSKIVVNANLRGWDREPAPEKAAQHNINDLAAGAAKRLASYDKEIPQPTAEAMKYARGMQQIGRADFDRERKLDDNEMGVYNYWLNKAELGTIKLNEALSFLATQIGDAIAFATVIHEGAHARDQQAGRLNDKDVIAGEVPAFKAEYDWLQVADPYGERICYLRAAFMTAQREHPSRLGAIGLSYLNHLAELQATQGDLKAIKEMVEKLGYKDGETHRQGNEASA
jgi:hypothetical protein